MLDGCCVDRLKPSRVGGRIAESARRSYVLSASAATRRLSVLDLANGRSGKSLLVAESRSGPVNIWGPSGSYRYLGPDSSTSPSSSTCSPSGSWGGRPRPTNAPIWSSPATHRRVGPRPARCPPRRPRPADPPQRRRQYTSLHFTEHLALAGIDHRPVPPTGAVVAHQPEPRPHPVIEQPEPTLSSIYRLARH
jgi:hypothetical protein